MSANTARYSHATGFGFDTASAPSTGENIGGGIIAGMKGGSALDKYSKNKPITRNENYPEEMHGTGDDGPINQQEAGDVGRYDYVPPSGDRNPSGQMSLAGEMSQDVRSEKERDRQKQLAMQNPWMRAQMVRGNA
jgi:hypothetical protein